MEQVCTQVKRNFSTTSSVYNLTRYILFTKEEVFTAGLATIAVFFQTPSEVWTSIRFGHSRTLNQCR